MSWGGIWDSILQAIFNESEYVDHHLHRYSRSYGKTAVQTATDWATEDSLTPFRAISGNGAYGSDANDEAQVFGVDDTPFIVGQTKFDIGGLLIVGVSNDNPFILRFVWGTGTMADAITAGQYITVMVKFDTTNPQLSAGIPIMIGCPKIAVDTKVWCQAKNVTDNATIDFFITESHGY